MTIRDLRGTPIDAVVDRFFDKICQGNAGDSVVEKLEIDDSNRILSFDVRIRHRQNTTIHIPFNGNKVITVWSLTTHARGQVDPINPDPNKVKLAVDTPVGQIEVNLTELLAVIVTLL
jgi:hypothetical protein